MELLPHTFKVIAIFSLGWLGVWSVVAIPLGQKLGWRPFRATPPEQKLALLMPLYAIAPIAITIANRQLGQTWADQGLSGTVDSAIELLLGWSIAIAGLSALLWLKRRCGLITLPLSEANVSLRASFTTQLLTGLGLLLLGLGIGGIEELVFRGWLQTQLELTFLPWVAAITASVIFALAHLVWEGRSGLWQQPGLWLLGMVLVSARWADGGAIAIAWGLHAGWVTGLAYIGEFLQPLPVADKPTWLTGRVAQPLTDIGDGILLVVTAGLIWWLSKGV